MSPVDLDAARLLMEMRAKGSQRNIEGRRRFGLDSRYESLGVSVPHLRAIGQPHRRDHALARVLWDSGISDAMVLATMIDDPMAVTRAQMERWARMCDNWGLTDALCCGLLDRTPFAEVKAHAWSHRKAEFVKRCGFVLMAGMAVHRKELPDDVFLRFLPVIRREAHDERNFVRKAVNWVLRQIGKRNPRLRAAAVAEAHRIATLDSRSAHWIARDALRELETRRRGRDARPGGRGR